MHYLILARTPFPNEWRPLASCWIQEAERALCIGRYYHDKAIKLKQGMTEGLYLYEWDDAQKIASYHTKTHPYAQTKVLAYINPSLVVADWNFKLAVN